MKNHIKADEKDEIEDKKKTSIKETNIPKKEIKNHNIKIDNNNENKHNNDNFRIIEHKVKKVEMNDENNRIIKNKSHKDNNKNIISNKSYNNESKKYSNNKIDDFMDEIDSHEKKSQKELKKIISKGMILDQNRFKQDN